MHPSSPRDKSIHRPKNTDRFRKNLPCGSILKGCAKKKDQVTCDLVFFQRCVPQAERDAPLGRDVCFASDVRFAREEAEHITSLCDEVAIHHYGEAITSLRQRRNITPKTPATSSRKKLAISPILCYTNVLQIRVKNKKRVQKFLCCS